METILNLAWLLVTLAVVWLWRFRWTVSGQRRTYSTRIEAVAMVCVLALLFPVISLTDDLHPETVAVDAASGKRNACLIAASAPHVRATAASSPTHLGAGIISRPFASAGWIIAPVFDPPSKLHDPGMLAGVSSGRSPPSRL